MKIVGRSILIALLIFSLGHTPAIASSRLPYHKTETRTFNAANLNALTVSNVNGRIEIKGAHTDRVELRAEFFSKRKSDLERIRIESNTQHGRLTIHVKFPKRHRFLFFPFSRRSRGRVDLYLTVPKDLATNLTSVNGDLFIENMKAEITAHTVNGDFTLKNTEGSVAIDTVNGDLKADHITACLKFDSVNGDVEIKSLRKGACNAIRLETVNGDFSLALDPNVLKTVKINTVNGDLETGFAAKISGGRRSKHLVFDRGPVTIEAHTVNGDLTLKPAP